MKRRWRRPSGAVFAPGRRRSSSMTSRLVIMGFFSRRAKQAAPEHPGSLSGTAAESAAGGGPERPEGEALPVPEPEAVSSEKLSADEAALSYMPEIAEISESIPADAAEESEESSGSSSPHAPDSSLPLNPDSFASTEDYLLAVVKYAVHPSPESDSPGRPEAGAERTWELQAKTEKADDYFLDRQEDGQETPGRGRAHGNETGGSDCSGAPQDDSNSGRLLKDLAPACSDEELEALRRLVLGREIDGLEAIHRQLSDRRLQAEALSQVVAEAIRLKSRQDDQMVVALKSTVDQIMRSSVRNNPAELADNLFPVMGPAIRRSISEGIRGMLQDFSRVLEKSFSLTGLKWRFEAARTGKKFSEVVMLKTIEYQVEQVFFIHTVTGIRLIHLYHEKALHADDGDQVSAMLTVMQQFVKDSFAEGDLSTVEFGEFNIYIARAPQAYLACVVRGQAPSDLRTDMQIALEQMVMECADELDGYRSGGSTEPFQKVAHYAEALLSSRYKDEGGKLPIAARLLPALLMLAILGSIGFWAYKKYETERLELMVSEAVQGVGVIPLKIEPSLFGVWNITVLRDELAESLAYGSGKTMARKIVEGGLPRDRFVIQALPFVSQDVEIVMERVYAFLKNAPDGIDTRPAVTILENGDIQARLEGAASIPWAISAYGRLMAVPGVKEVVVKVKDPDNDVVLSINDGLLSLEGRPSLVPWVFSIYERLMNMSGISGVRLNLVDRDNGVSAFIENGALTFEGQASLGWQTAVGENAMTVSAGRLVDLRGVEDDAPTRKLKDLMDRLNQVVILFPLGKEQPVPEDADKLDRAVDDLLELEKLADSMGMSISLTIYGHADATGSDSRNYDLSQARTKTVAAKLYARGSAIPVFNYGLGAEFAARTGGEETAFDDQASRKIELRVDLNQKPVSLHK